jgi:hypothetical protein
VRVKLEREIERERLGGRDRWSEIERDAESYRETQSSGGLTQEKQRRPILHGSLEDAISEGSSSDFWRR